MIKRLSSCRHNLMGIIIIFSVMMRLGKLMAFTSSSGDKYYRLNHYHINLSWDINWGRASSSTSSTSLRQSQTSLFDEINTRDIHDLPIYSILNDLRESIQNKPNLLLEAAPGAGKTTIVPLVISSLQSKDNKVIVVEPRRVATRRQHNECQSY